MNFLARLIVGSIIAFATVTILENSKRKSEGNSKKDGEREEEDAPTENSDNDSASHTHDKYLFDFEIHGAPSSKRKITRSIKELMKEYKTRKIGRTGDRNGRLGNYSGKYNALYLLTKSKNLDTIRNLETAYIEKFADQLDNDGASMFGASETADGWYYLYIAVR